MRQMLCQVAGCCGFGGATVMGSQVPCVEPHARGASHQVDTWLCRTQLDYHPEAEGACLFLVFRAFFWTSIPFMPIPFLRSPWLELVHERKDMNRFNILRTQLHARSGAFQTLAYSFQCFGIPKNWVFHEGDEGMCLLISS